MGYSVITLKNSHIGNVLRFRIRYIPVIRSHPVIHAPGLNTVNKANSRIKSMSMSVVGMPLVFLFFMFPLLVITGIKQLENIALVMPTYYYLDLLKKVIIDESTLAEMLYGFGVLVVSITLASFILLVVCKKKGFE